MAIQQSFLERDEQVAKLYREGFADREVRQQADRHVQRRPAEAIKIHDASLWLGRREAGDDRLDVRVAGV